MMIVSKFLSRKIRFFRAHKKQIFFFFSFPPDFFSSSFIITDGRSHPEMIIDISRKIYKIVKGNYITKILFP
jgi:hypothetical protein